MRRLVIILAAVVAIHPTDSLAQRTESLARRPGIGLVVASKGYVTAAKGAGRAPIPLKVRDEIGFDDRIVTGDGSTARLLIDGKALVALQERTVVTIVRAGGPPTVRLESGRIALALAAEKLRPGESMHLATPNATARMGGARVVAEVMQWSAEAGGVAPAVVTHLYVLGGTVEATRLGPNARMIRVTPAELPAVSAGFTRWGFGYGHVPEPPAVRQRAIDAGVSLLLQVSDALAERGRAATSPFSVESDERRVWIPPIEAWSPRTRTRSDAPVSSTAAPAPAAPVAPAPTIGPSVGSPPSNPHGPPSIPGAPTLPPQAGGPQGGSGGNGGGGGGNGNGPPPRRGR